MRLGRCLERSEDGEGGQLVMSVLKDCPGPAQARAEPMGLESGFKVALDPGLARDQHLVPALKSGPSQDCTPLS